MAIAATDAERRARSDNPFGPDLTNAEIDWLLTREPLSRIDPGNFPAGASLRDILRNETRVLRYRHGDIVVRDGDYGNSAFVMIEGQVRVVLRPKLSGETLGRRQSQKRGLWRALAQLWTNHALPEVRTGAEHNAAFQLRRLEGADYRVTLADPDQIIAEHRTAVIGAGEMFGEIAAVSRMPRTATIFADGPAELLEIRWQGLRDIRRRDRGFREHVERLYRERSLAVQLRESPLFKHLDSAGLEAIAAETAFESFGEIDWQRVYRALEDLGAAERVEQEPVVAHENQPADRLIIVRSGFARLSQAFDHGHRTIGYLGPGDVFGLEEIAHHARGGEAAGYRHSLRALGSLDILRIPAKAIALRVLPGLPAHLQPAPLRGSDRQRMAWGTGSDEAEVSQAMLEFLGDNRLINGTAAMLIDLDRCTRCDECVRACADTHDNNPRFIRHGRQFDHFMIANACMHCADPVCMIGCPTGAIHRVPEVGSVVINDQTCIGCGTCAASCPYQNIRMVESRDESGAFHLDPATGAAVVRATKCDLCVDQPGGPACQRACPNDALVRINLRDMPALASWVGRG